jgi:hypothetical protein
MASDFSVAWHLIPMLQLTNLNSKYCYTVCVTIYIIILVLHEKTHCFRRKSAKTVIITLSPDADLIFSGFDATLEDLTRISFLKFKPRSWTVQITYVRWCNITQTSLSVTVTKKITPSELTRVFYFYIKKFYQYPGVIRSHNPVDDDTLDHDTRTRLMNVVL